MQQRFLFLALAFAVLFSAPARSQKFSGENPARVTTEKQVADERYIIGPEDVLNVDVWHELELSAKGIPVRPDGKISLSLLNDVQAAGLTPAELAAQITEKLKKYVTLPQVTVVVTAINSKRIFLMGSVMRPGVYPLIPDMTVLQALSSAGGLQQYANTKKIYILRDQNGAMVKINFHYKRALRGELGEQTTLLAGDTVVVP